MIVNPITKVKYELNSEMGQQILKKYINTYNNGGMFGRVKNTLQEVFQRVKSFIKVDEDSEISEESEESEDDEMVEIDEDRIKKNKTYSNLSRLDISIPEVVKPFDAELNEMIKWVHENLGFQIQLSNEIIDEKEFWINIINKYKSLYNRMGSVSPIGRISPSPMTTPDFDRNMVKYRNQIKRIVSPNGYRLQTTVEGDLQGYFMDPIPFE